MRAMVYIVSSGGMSESSIIGCFSFLPAARRFAIRYISNISRNNKFPDSHSWSRSERPIQRNITDQWYRQTGSGIVGDTNVWDFGPTWVNISRYLLNEDLDVQDDLRSHVFAAMGPKYRSDWTHWPIVIQEETYRMDMVESKCILYRAQGEKEVWSWDHKPTPEEFIRDYLLFTVHRS